MASTIKVDTLRGSTGNEITVPTGQTLTLTDGLAIGSLPVVTVAKGGTNIASFAAGDLLYATGSTTLAKLNKGTAEQVLAMNSGATAPDWGSVDLTVLPTISVAKGGTNIASFAAGDILYATGSTTLAKLAKGTSLQGLQTNSGATAPEWVASPQSVLTAEGDILYASGANTLAKLAKGSDDEVLTLASGVPSWAAAAGGGKLGQIVVAEFNTGVNGYMGMSFGSWSTAVTIQITPTINTSQIYLVFSGIAAGGGSSSGFSHGIFNGSTSITETGLAGSQTMLITMSGLHSPASTALQTYEWKVRVNSSGGHNAYLSSQTSNPERIVYMTAMEILA